MRRLLPVLLMVLLSAAALPAAAQRSTPTPTPAAAVEATPEATAAPVELLTVEIVAEFPHDPNAYTQGLLLHDGEFYESAGQYGESDLRRVDPDTGEVQQQVEVPEQYFAEGLALVDDRLIQITWKEETALVYDRETFEQVDTFDYTGEGWGLCYDGRQLVMSDGTEKLTLRAPETFEATDTVTVLLDGEPLSAWSFQGAPLSQLNELECVGDTVYANVWYTDIILRIDMPSAVVTGVIFAGDLLPQADWMTLRNEGGVLNGIAYNAEADTFYITGKLWPKLFEVRFVPAD
mgnify:CR=1 FL=1